MLFYNNEKIGLLVDGHNMYGTARSLQFDIDYRKLHDLFVNKGILIRACYYTVMADEENVPSPLRPLVDWLEYNGWKIITKPMREHQDGTGAKRYRGNIIVELAVDAMDLADHVDHIVIFSGDGDFCHLIDSLQRRGRRVTIVSSIKSTPSVCSNDLRRMADNFIDMADIQSSIMRDSNKPVGAVSAGVRTRG